MYTNGKKERGLSSSADNFSHAIGDVVLVRWSDERIYYAKIKTINKNRQTCQVMFEDNRRGTAEFDQIHAVDSAVEDWIACIVCKFGTSDSPNQIVLCDKCGIAFHQKCHLPNIADSALEPSAPWVCHFCKKGKPNPHLERNEDDTPFAEEDTKPIGRRRLSSSTSNHTGLQTDVSRRIYGATSREGERDSESSSNESTTRNKPERWEGTQQTRTLTVGKRHHADYVEIAMNSPQPPKKKSTSPGPSMSPPRKVGEESRRREFGPLQASVIDSQKVAAYAKWKQDKLQTTQRKSPAVEKAGCEKTPPPQVIRHNEPRCAPADDAQPSKEAFQLVLHASSSPQTGTLQPKGLHQESVDNVHVTLEQVRPPPKERPLCQPILQTKSSTFSMLYQRKAPGIGRSNFESASASKGPSKAPPSKNDVPLTSLAEQFEMQYVRVMRNLLTAHSRITTPAKASSTASWPSSAANRHFHESLRHASQSRGRQERLQLSQPTGAQHSKGGSSNRHDFDARVSAVSAGLANRQPSATRTNQEENTKYKCAGCGRHAQFICSRCQNVWYCSRQCQEKAYMHFCRNCTSKD